jgi:hypothetical protein
MADHLVKIVVILFIAFGYCRVSLARDAAENSFLCKSPQDGISNIGLTFYREDRKDGIIGGKVRINGFFVDRDQGVIIFDNILERFVMVNRLEGEIVFDDRLWTTYPPPPYGNRFTFYQKTLALVQKTITSKHDPDGSVVITTVETQYRCTNTQP